LVTTSRAPAVVLVHGAFVDASGSCGVIVAGAEFIAEALGA
jgi:hypothetical protein